MAMSKNHTAVTSANPVSLPFRRVAFSQALVDSRHDNSETMYI